MTDVALTAKLVDIGEAHPQHNMKATKLIDAVDATVPGLSEGEILKVEDIPGMEHLVDVRSPETAEMGKTMLMQGAQRVHDGMVASDRVVLEGDKEKKTEKTKAVAVEFADWDAQAPKTSTGEVGDVKLESADKPKLKTANPEMKTPKDEMPKAATS